MHNPPLLTIIYDPNNGDVFTDSEISLFVEILQQIDSPKMYCVGNFLFIEEVLTAIAKDYINHKDVVFQYKDQTFTSNQYGVCVDAPKQFTCPSVMLCEQRILAACKKREHK